MGEIFFPLSYLLFFNRASIIVIGCPFDFVHGMKPGLSNTDASWKILLN